MTTHVDGAVRLVALSEDDWHHGYSAGALLRLVALALRECVECANDEAWEQNDCFRTLADAVERRASTLHWSAYDVVSELCYALQLTLLTLCGSGSFYPRADYLLFGLANQQPDWIETMKRRKHWLALVQEDKEGMK